MSEREDAVEDEAALEAVRDRFGDALEGTLAGEEREAFERALAEHAALREEFEAYRAMVGALGEAAPRIEGADPERPGGEPMPALVPKVQARIRRRSGGRYFRDRFSARPSRGGWELSLLVAALVLLLALLAFRLLDDVVVTLP